MGRRLATYLNLKKMIRQFSMQMLLIVALILASLQNQWVVAVIVLVALILSLRRKGDKEEPANEVESISDRSGVEPGEILRDSVKANVESQEIGIFEEPENLDPDWDKWMMESADLIKTIESTSSRFASTQSFAEYILDKLMEMTERAGGELIEDGSFDIRRHEAVPPRKVRQGAEIIEVLRPGLKRESRIYLKAKVRVRD